jgi:methylated-DNA-[protein]-cysteine S-methyltransferase
MRLSTFDSPRSGTPEYPVLRDHALAPRGSAPIGALVVAGFPTALGWMAVAADESDRLSALTLGHASLRAATGTLTLRLVAGTSVVRAADCNDALRGLIARLEAYAEGAADTFQDVPLSPWSATLFQRAVIEQCRRIPFGTTISYGELARRAGYPGAARATGQVMATNRVPLVVPCHRVIASGGALGGYSAPQGLTMKRRLLRHEAAYAPVAHVHG